MERQDNILPLFAAPETPRIDYCAACWPFWKAAAPSARVAAEVAAQ